MKRSILFTTALLIATMCGTTLQAEPPTTANVTNAVTNATSSDVEIVQVAQRNNYRRYSYRPNYQRYNYRPNYRYYSRPYYSPYRYRYNYTPYRYGPGYYGTGRYGYDNYGPFSGGVRVGPVDVWW